MPNRSHVLVVGAVTGLLLLACLILDRADEDSTLGTLADWAWWGFVISAVLLVAVGVAALVGRLRPRRA